MKEMEMRSRKGRMAVARERLSAMMGLTHLRQFMRQSQM